MAKKKLQSINYTSRDFESIREDLETFARRYYPDTYKDFNEASFGSLMLDTVSYVGDILSFYLDYQANESFLDTAMEYNNVVKLARQFGFKLNTNPSTFGLLTFYLKIPATLNGVGPDTAYAPVLEAGSEFSSTAAGFYTLIDNVDFGASSNQVVVGTVNDTTGVPTSYIVRAQGRAVSGQLATETYEIGDFERFRKITLAADFINSIVRVTDREGHDYVEVDNLSQNIVFKAIRNTTTSRATVPNILKAVPVARRYTTEYKAGKTQIQFGYGSTNELLTDSVVDPTNLVLDLSGRSYVTDTNFDPTKLISGDKFGIGPANTTLTVAYRQNTTVDANAAVNTITKPGRIVFKFSNPSSLLKPTRASVVGSLEVTNEEPFVGSVSLPSSEEVKHRVYGYYAAQNRAVTLEDYKALVYGMPTKFGSIRRAQVVRDFDEFKRNLNLYLISENTSGKLVATNQLLKNNVRNWILQHKMINDTVDILDAQIVNFGVEYEIALDYGTNRFTAISKADGALAKLLTEGYDIGESIDLADIYKTLSGLPGVVDVSNVRIVSKAGGVYSEAVLDFERLLTSNGRSIRGESSVVYELKFPNNDLKGSVR